MIKHFQAFKAPLHESCWTYLELKKCIRKLSLKGQQKAKFSLQKGQEGFKIKAQKSNILAFIQNHL